MVIAKKLKQRDIISEAYNFRINHIKPDYGDTMPLIYTCTLLERSKNLTNGPCIENSIVESEIIK